MAARFLCTRAEPPEGFEVRIPSKSDLLRGTVVLLVAEEAEGDRLLRDLWKRFCGVLVVPGAETVLESAGPLAWKLRVEPRMIDHLRPFVEGIAAAIATGKEALDQKVVWQKEVARLNQVHAAVREHYNLVTERLRHNMEQVSDLNAHLHEQLERLQQAEQALGLSERDLAITLDSIGEAVVATDLEIRIRRMNPAAEELSGWSRDEAIGKPIEQVFPLSDLQDRQILPDLVEQVLNQGRVMGLPRNTRLLDRQNIEHRVAHSSAPILDENGRSNGIVFVFRDMTEQLKLEGELRQRQRMDSLGQLAGGVAHDFNNLLLGIQGFAELLERRMGSDEQGLHLLRSIQTASERAAGLTRQLLAFARKQVPQMQRVDLHRILRDVIELATHTFDRRVAIRTRLLARPATIIGEAALLQTMLLNLLINARDAMPEGGTLSITTGTLERGKLPRELADLPPGDYLTIDVEDTGVGIPPEHLDRIFEPFFTTKTPGKGTGLGLSALYGIMWDHKGKVTVSSQVGRGTKFKLYLPLAEAIPEPAPTEGSEAGLGHILVVDDEDFVRNFLRMGLEACGYTVSLAESGQEALKLIAGKPRDYDLVLLDLNMPVMNGRDVLAAIHAAAPALPVIVASGYVTDSDQEELIQLGARAILAKPFKINELRDKISEQLTGSRHEP